MAETVTEEKTTSNSMLLRDAYDGVDMLARALVCAIGSPNNRLLVRESINAGDKLSSVVREIVHNLKHGVVK